MQKLDKIQEVKVAEQSVEVDPRSKTTADGAFNYIGTGKPGEKVGCGRDWRWYGQYVSGGAWPWGRKVTLRT